ncbi:MAG: DUF805 domain-containing protein [Rhodobacteraceae bacterium]|nr:DUF805 domain-containing protein [Paracoccaceae bacterium]TVR44648.1 MAG: DUF805 domain-containing protein [Paracoccaceae bacterium]
MTFTKAVTSAFRNALKFEGRSRRPEYWWFFLFVFAGAFVIGVIEHLALGGGQWLTRLFQLVVFLPFLAVAWRRLQDTGRPGWWVLVPSAIVVVSALVAGSVSRQMLMGRLADTPEAAAAPGALILVLGLLQVVAGAVIIWWMSRPSQRGPNAYGPEPRVR